MMDDHLATVRTPTHGARRGEQVTSTTITGKTCAKKTEMYNSLHLSVTVTHLSASDGQNIHTSSFQCYNLRNLIKGI